ncbi:oxidoreductase [Zhongshania aquimaris]|uniref:SDR family NAD(P)-dependent oxidoreductase n=1 Tax=Zhongshania aquimaris TaxID=2857107 RepID=A0ABS6VW41_9GAMM|nr:SDR family NAD(P)-dependent oxidoreductase [Zhongshania aquimaris]
MAKKTAIVTGANAGLGFAISAALAEQNYRVILACRNLEKSAAALEQLKQQFPDADFLLMQLDVSNLESIGRFATAFAEQVGELDLLINNAGITDVPLSRNTLGHESQLATNYLGPFALIGKLLPQFKKETECRIVNICSLAHRFGKIALDDLNWERDTYKPMKGYARSKVALMSYTIELNRRLQQSGSNIIALSSHPGFAATEITRKQGEPTNPVSAWIQSKIEPLIPLPKDAARATLMAALSPDARGGEYYGPGGFLEIGGAPDQAKINAKAKDSETAKQLWSLTEEMTGVSYLS